MNRVLVPPRNDASRPFTFQIWQPEDDQEPDLDYLPRPVRRQEDLSAMGQLTLRQAFDKYMLKQLETDKAARATIEAYRNALGHWERLMLADLSVGKNPQLYEIDDELLELFRAMADQAPTTCNKWFRHLRAILNLMGPRIAHNKRSRRNRCYFYEVPWLEDLETDAPDPVEMPEDHVNSLYEVCPLARWPFKARTGAEPGDWWRCSVVMLITYGMRREDWLWLRRSSVNVQKKTFAFKAKKTKKDHNLVTNEVVLAHLAKLQPTGDYLFSPTKAHQQIYDQWHWLQDKAGIKRPDGQHYTFHDLRDTCAARYHEQFPGTAELLLGHALPRSSKVTAESYLGRQLLKPVHRAIREIKPPASFLTLSRHDDPKQRKLF